MPFGLELLHACADGHINDLDCILRENAGVKFLVIDLHRISCTLATMYNVQRQLKDASDATNGSMKLQLQDAADDTFMSVQAKLGEIAVKNINSVVYSTGMMLAIKRRHVDTLRMLLKNPNLSLQYATPALMSHLLRSAVRSAQFEISAVLISSGADPACMIGGSSPIAIAAGLGDSRVVSHMLEFLTDRGLLLESAGSICHALEAGCANGRVDVVKTLIAFKCGVDDRCVNAPSPLMIASVNGHKKVVDLLLKNKSNVHIHAVPGCSGLLPMPFGNFTPSASCTCYAKNMLCLHRNVFSRAQLMNCASVVRTQYGGHITAPETGLTALHLACQFGRKSVVKSLLANNANVHTGGWALINDNQWQLHTPLSLAAKSKRRDLISLIVRHIESDCIFWRSELLSRILILTLGASHYNCTTLPHIGWIPADVMHEYILRDMVADARMLAERSFQASCLVCHVHDGVGMYIRDMPAFAHMSLFSPMRMCSLQSSEML